MVCVLNDLMLLRCVRVSFLGALFFYYNSTGRGMVSKRGKYAINRAVFHILSGITAMECVTNS